MIKTATKIVALTSLAAFAVLPVQAGTKTFKEVIVVEEEPTPWYNASVSTGVDSLYMFRGANLLRSSGDVSSLYWTNADFTWNISDVDSITIGNWMGFGLGNAVPGYREGNAYAGYARAIGDLSLGLGYTFYYIFPTAGTTYANELNVSAAYDVDLGFMTLTPSATYYFNLGPDSSTGHGAVDTASSYLDLRLDGSIAITEAISIDPWTAFGLNFGYNLDGNGNSFNGANNLEFGVAVPWQINEVITVSGYAAYSYAFENLWGTTQSNTFWGGGSVAFAF